MLSQEIIDHLKVLGIKEENYETLTMDDAVKAYRKLAMTVHPDKAGKESTDAFQNLNNSVHFLKKKNMMRMLMT